MRANTLTCRMQKVCLIHTSISSMAEARTLANDLMRTHLAACVQISGPGISIYRWKDKIEQADEYYISIKTSTARGGDVVNWLKQHHPYNLPEIVWTACETTEAYADWVHADAL